MKSRQATAAAMAEPVATLLHAEASAGGGWTFGLGWLNAPLLHVGDEPVTVFSLIYASAALTLALLLSALLRRGLDRLEQRGTSLSHAAVYTLGRVVHYVLLLIGLMIALSMLGLDTGRLAIVAGALGVGLGFGLQAIFNNFVSGLIILFERSLKVGDFVELESGVHGEVQEINIRATRITTNDNIDIVVPNSEFVSGRVVNWTMREISRRVRVPFGVAYGSDKELVKKAALEAAAEVPFTLALEGPRRPQVWLTAFGDSSLDFELVVWLNADATKRPSAVRAAYTWALETALAKYCLNIPFPQRDLHLRSVFGLDGDEALAAFAPGHAPVAPEQPEPPSISRQERRELARNDAQGDVEREIENSLEAPEDVAPDSSRRDPPDDRRPL
jgi:small-conductance mechanosensitive channel